MQCLPRSGKEGLFDAMRNLLYVYTARNGMDLWPIPLKRPCFYLFPNQNVKRNETKRSGESGMLRLGCV